MVHWFSTVTPRPTMVRSPTVTSSRTVARSATRTRRPSLAPRYRTAPVPIRQPSPISSGASCLSVVEAVRPVGARLLPRAHALEEVAAFDGEWLAALEARNPDVAAPHRKRSGVVDHAATVHALVVDAELLGRLLIVEHRHLLGTHHGE